MKGHQENNEKKSGMQIWYCQNCNQVHLRATNVMLDFSKKEFLGLSDAILGILRYEFSSEDLKSIPNYNAETEDVLFADTIV
jgi:Zn-finger protein